MVSSMTRAATASIAVNSFLRIYTETERIAYIVYWYLHTSFTNDTGGCMSLPKNMKIKISPKIAYTVH